MPQRSIGNIFNYVDVVSIGRALPVFSRCAARSEGRKLPVQCLEWLQFLFEFSLLETEVPFPRLTVMLSENENENENGNGNENSDPLIEIQIYYLKS
ncbi:hypothetical protein J6590_020532 [Homalodisca vitripennis]|nr:hypothetical protein J6590_020532 [Homalodisca vitripennis]